MGHEIWPGADLPAACHVRKRIRTGHRLLPKEILFRWLARVDLADGWSTLDRAWSRYLRRLVPLHNELSRVSSRCPVLGSLAVYTACTLHQPRSNIPLEKWYLAVVGHNAIRISPVVRRGRRLEGTTHGMLFTLNYSRHRGRNTHYPTPPPRRPCARGS